MTHDEINDLKKWLAEMQELRVQRGDWPERNNLCSSFYNACQKLLEEIDFREMLIHDLKCESSAFDQGRESAIEWVMLHLQEEMKAADERELNNETETEDTWGELIISPNPARQGDSVRVRIRKRRTDYITFIKRMLEAWRTRES